MKKYFVVIIALIFLCACTVSRKNCVPKMNLELTAIMDTITVVIDGKIKNSELNKTSVKIELLSKNNN